MVVWLARQLPTVFHLLQDATATALQRLQIPFPDWIMELLQTVRSTIRNSILPPWRGTRDCRNLWI